MKTRYLLLTAAVACSESQEPPRVYVGVAKQTFIAVVVDDDCANAFVTDGRDGWASVWNWMEARPANNAVSFKDKGVSLYFSLDTLKASLMLPTSANEFEVELVDEPAGAYIAGATVDNVRYSGAWIFTSSGDQRGAVMAGSALLPSLLSAPDQTREELADGVVLDVGRVTTPTCKTQIDLPDGVITAGNGGGSGNGAGDGGSGDGGSGDGGDGGICCKTCGSSSKACGDSCIARDKTCHQGRGCACDG